MYVSKVDPRISINVRMNYTRIYVYIYIYIYIYIYSNRQFLKLTQHPQTCRPSNTRRPV